MSSDWSDTMLDIAVTFFYHPIYMILASEATLNRRLVGALLKRTRKNNANLKLNLIFYSGNVFGKKSQILFGLFVSELFQLCCYYRFTAEIKQKLLLFYRKLKSL